MVFMLRRLGQMLLGISLLHGANACAFGLLGNEVSLGMATPEPSGLSAKFWMSRETAVDIFSEWSWNHRELATHADYLTHDFQQFELEGATMPMYYGFGLRMSTRHHGTPHFGVRIPIGVSYFWNTAPLDLFGEFATRANIVPATNFAIDLMLGVRYRFIP